MRNSRSGQEAGARALAVSLIGPLVLVIALLVLIVGVRGSVEQTVSNLASLLPVGYAFAAGMVASVNPCGALMLPSYIFFQLGADDEVSDPTLERMLRALRLAIATTSGFAVIFGAVGVVVSVTGQWLTAVFPFAGLMIGLAMAGLGLWLLISHRSLGILAASRVSVTPQQSLGNMFLFGIAYAISSLSCTLPIFLVVVGSALTAGDWTASMAQFLGYALGMGAVMAAVSVGTSLVRQVVERWLRRLMPYVHRASALFLLGAGLYLIYYWIFEAGLLS
ncbi:MAG: cytochrome c biogenesis protein CcdA [Anaerolineae bacterium]